MWGRLLGVGFAVPCAYFIARGAIKGPLARRLGLLFAMGGTQGLVGWWMVRSGLKVSRTPDKRLSRHLPLRCSCAFSLLCMYKARRYVLVRCCVYVCVCTPQEPEHEWQQVRVSPYRLAGHLVSAFAIYATLVWTTLDLG